MSSDHLMADWAAHAAVRGVFTTSSRSPDSVFGSANLALHVGDDAARVLRNRAALKSRLGLDRVIYLDQVHGVGVIEASAATTELAQRADAVWTRARRVGCAVLTADCLPVMIADRGGSCVGVAHCGWRGLAAGVLPALVRVLPVPASSLMAHIGPGIGAARYEVGRDVLEALGRPGAHVDECFRPGVRPQKYYADLETLARWQLRELGVRWIEGGGYCTARDPRFYSFRKDGITGRFASVVWLG